MKMGEVKTVLRSYIYLWMASDIIFTKEGAVVDYNYECIKIRGTLQRCC